MESWDGMTDRRGKGGFVVRYELLGIIGIMIAHLIGAVWWSSTITSNVLHMASNLERLTKVVEKASLDNSNKFDKLDTIVLAHEHRLTKIETKQGVTYE